VLNLPCLLLARFLAVVIVIPAGSGLALDKPFSITAKSVALSQSANPIGKIRPLGMLELSSVNINGLRLADLSDLAWDEDDNVLYALSDHGALFWLRPIFHNGMLVDVMLLKAVPLRELGTDNTLTGKRTDSEGMDILRGHNGIKGDAELLISFERVPRIVRYRPDGHALHEYALPAALREIKAYRGPNKALEAVAFDARHGILTAPEYPLKSELEGYNRIFSLSGSSWLYPIAPNSGITSMKSLGNRGLLILERDYKSVLGGFLIALKKVAAVPANPSTPLTVETLVTLDSSKGFNIDNFEGLAQHRNNRFFLISDNNDMFFQRTLLLYFELLE